MMNGKDNATSRRPSMSNRRFRFILWALVSGAISVVAEIALGFFYRSPFAFMLGGVLGIVVLSVLAVLGWLYNSGRVETKAAETEVAVKELSSLLEVAPEALKNLSEHLREEERRTAWILWYLVLTVGIPMASLLLVLAMLPSPIRELFFTLPGITLGWGLMAVAGGPVAMLSNSKRLWPQVLGWSMMLWGTGMTLLGLLWPLAFGAVR